jgi:hypothetical protein
MDPGADTSFVSCTRGVYTRVECALRIGAPAERAKAMAGISGALESDPFEAVRSACERVAARARHVRIDDDGLARFAAAIPAGELGRAAAAAHPALGGSAEAIAAYVLCLDAINFGSGWFPQLAKPEGRSGYRTVEAALSRHFEARGAPPAAELAGWDAPRMTALLGQERAGPDVPELMELYARAWRDLGALVASRFGGAFLELVRAARGAAAELVRILLEMPLYRDVARYEELDVPFLKRAQITAADLAAALPDRAAFRDLDQLTLFADNLVPHVLRLDGVLVFDPALVARIDAEELLVAGSPEEVEIRACAVTAVEKLCRALAGRGSRVHARDLDSWLWSRGASPRYKARPRHRARCAYY